MTTYFFCGIGGIGMSSIALYLRSTGATVRGSDRLFDLGRQPQIRQNLEGAGITICPQDGSGVKDDIDVFVVTRAVNTECPDIAKAVELDLKIKKRPQMLADIFHSYRGIAVAGTSGKTTTTAMIGHILVETGKDPVMINGGISLNTYHGQAPSNLIYGNGDICVIEADESDKSLEAYIPSVAVLTNVSLDHRAVEENVPLFADFLNRATLGCVINADCPEIQQMKIETGVRVVSWSLQDTTATYYAHDITFDEQGSHFKINDIPCDVPFLGLYNIENTLAAIGACSFFGISPEQAIGALASFKGTKKRMEKLGQACGVSVFEDYAHNPAKISAAVQGLKLLSGRLFIIYQIHGPLSARLMKNDLAKVFDDLTDDRTMFYLMDIFTAGAPAPEDIHATDVIKLMHNPSHITYCADRPKIIKDLCAKVQKGDRIVVMGARDDTLTNFGLDIVKAIEQKG